jgi:hypothetical protein
MSFMHRRVLSLLVTPAAMFAFAAQGTAQMKAASKDSDKAMLKHAR